MVVATTPDPNHMLILVPHSPKKLLPKVSHHHLYVQVQSETMNSKTLNLGLHHLRHLSLYHEQRSQSGQYIVQPSPVKVKLPLAW